MTKSYDVVVIGAGHNGLVCAAYLARAGKSVLVLERSEIIGGASKTRELASGVDGPACAHILHGLQPKVIKDLALKGHGLDFGGSPLKTIALAEDGNHLALRRGGIDGGGVTAADQSVYPDFLKRMERHAKALAPQLMKSPPRLAPDAGFKNTKQLALMGWDIRFGLGREAMSDFLRIVGMNIHGLLDEVFESEALKGALAFDATLGTPFEPRMASTVLTYIYRLAGLLENEMTIPKGGMGNVADALAKAATAAGAEIQTSKSVKSVLLNDSQAVGVVLEGGEEVRAAKIISNADPKTTFLKLVGPRNLEAGFANRIHNNRTDGRAAKVNLVLKDLPTFTGLAASELGNRLVVAPSRRYLELAFNPSKYGDLPDAPAMEITLPTVGDPDLAKDGKHVLSAVIQYVPYELNGGWDAGRKTLLSNVIKVLSDYAPGIEALVETSECLAPPDIEAEFGMTGGNWHHGDLTIDQMFMMRPTYGTSQYRTPSTGSIFVVQALIQAAASWEQQVTMLHRQF